MGMLYKVNNLFLKEFKRAGGLDGFSWENFTEEVGEKIVLPSKFSLLKLKNYKILRIFFSKNV